MKYYAEFLHTDLSGATVPALGSDSVLILDGRLSLFNMVQCAAKQKERLRQVQPHYTGFRIVKGDRFREANPVLWTQHYILGA